MYCCCNICEAESCFITVWREVWRNVGRTLDIPLYVLFLDAAMVRKVCAWTLQKKQPEYGKSLPTLDIHLNQLFLENVRIGLHLNLVPSSAGRAEDIPLYALFFDDAEFHGLILCLKTEPRRFLYMYYFVMLQTFAVQLLRSSFLSKEAASAKRR